MLSSRSFGSGMTTCGAVSAERRAGLGLPERGADRDGAHLGLADDAAMVGDGVGRAVEAIERRKLGHIPVAPEERLRFVRLPDNLALVVDRARHGSLRPALDDALPVPAHGIEAGVPKRPVKQERLADDLAVLVDVVCPAVVLAG